MGDLGQFRGGKQAQDINCIFDRPPGILAEDAITPATHQQQFLTPLGSRVEQADTITAFFPEQIISKLQPLISQGKDLHLHVTPKDRAVTAIRKDQPALASANLAHEELVNMTDFKASDKVPERATDNRLAGQVWCFIFLSKTHPLVVDFGQQIINVNRVYKGRNFGALFHTMVLLFRHPGYAEAVSTKKKRDAFTLNCNTNGPRHP